MILTGWRLRLDSHASKRGLIPNNVLAAIFYWPFRFRFLELLQLATASKAAEKSKTIPEITRSNLNKTSFRAVPCGFVDLFFASW
jgi:hypothetical protein